MYILTTILEIYLKNTKRTNISYLQNLKKSTISQIEMTRSVWDNDVIFVLSGRQSNWVALSWPWVALNSLSTSADPSAHGATEEPSVWLWLSSANQREEATTHN